VGRTASGAVASTGVVETMGLEPTTPCLQSRCSSQLSYVPEGLPIVRHGVRGFPAAGDSGAEGL
jgi:hypothetical protein